MMDLLEKRIVPVIVLDKVDAAVPLAEAFLAADLPVLEITLRTEAALGSVRAIARQFPNIRVGAGTVLQPAQVEEAAEAGATFIVTPGLNPAVISKAHELQLPIFPGVITPSEVEQAMSLGCNVLKFFPAEPSGGAKMLKAMSAPYAHTGVRFIPLGGVNASNMSEYFALPTVAAIGGSWLADKQSIADKNWSAITEHTTEALALAAKA